MCALRARGPRLRTRLALAHLFVVLCVLVRITNSQETGKCRTPGGKDGTCIDIKLCPYMLDMLLANRTAASEQYLRQSLCAQEQGGGVRICCDRPSCATENGQAGACVERTACRTRALGSRGTCQDTGAVCCPRRTFDGYISRSTGLPEFGFCGFGAPPPQDGNSAALGQFPWSALLVYRTEQGENERCGGTLISARYVITAAHCVDESLVKVRLGVQNLLERCTDLRGSCPMVMQVEKTYSHPTYNRDTGKDNLGMVKLATPAPYTNHIRPICLPDSALPRVLQNHPSLTVAGWGITQQLSGSDVAADSWMTFAEIPLRTNSVCRDAMRMWADILSAYQQETITEPPPNTICAGGTFNGELCAQDSGGAITWTPTALQNRPSGKNNAPTGTERAPSVIVAVHSVLAAGCKAPVPGVYTPVLAHLKWISDLLKSHYSIK